MHKALGSILNTHTHTHTEAEAQTHAGVPSHNTHTHTHTEAVKISFIGIETVAPSGEKGSVTVILMIWFSVLRDLGVNRCCEAGPT